MRHTRLTDPPDTLTEDDARRLLAAQRGSGASIAAFARARGVAAWRLYWWRKRLTVAAPPISTMTLVPAAVTADDEAAAIRTDAEVVIRVPGCIEIQAAGVSAHWVAALVAALGRATP